MSPRQPLRHESFTALVDALHAFAGCGPVSVRELGGQPFRSYSPEVAPSHHATLMAAMRHTGESFGCEEDPRAEATVPLIEAHS